jgi:hypothetical protein
MLDQEEAKTWLKMESKVIELLSSYVEIVVLEKKLIKHDHLVGSPPCKIPWPS